MKMLITIISSLFICSLSYSEDYNLTAGVPIKITDLEKGDIYHFTIKSSECSKLTFSFTMSNIYKAPFDCIKFSEIKSYYSTIYDLNNLTYSTQETNSNLIISASHIVYEYEFIYFNINLTSNIKEIIVKVDEEIGSYDLNNGSQKLNYLLSDFSYYFYRNVSEGLNINFNLTMDYLDSDPIKNIFVLEYNDWGITKRSRLLQNVSQSFIPIKQGNQLLISFSYIPSKRNIDFVGIIVKPSQKIYNFEIKMDLLAEFYNLENKKPITVQNLIPEKHYFFFINVEMYTEAEFIINMDKINGDPFNNTGILTYKKSEDSFNQYISFISYKYNTTIKENKMEISFNYLTSQYEKQKIALILQPLCKIDYINIKVDDEGGLYELIDGSRNISNLKPNTSYYFYTNTLYAQTLNINLTMRSSSSTPFSSINIYESSKKELSNSITATIPASLEQINDTLFISFSYTSSKDYCKYIFIEIRSSSFIDSITAKIEQNFEFHNFNINTPITFYNLTSEKFHYFNMKIGAFAKVYINITLDKLYDNAFNLSELYSTQELSFSDFYNKYPDKNFSQIIDNKTVISIVYKSNSPIDMYISYRIKPLYDFDLIKFNTFQINRSFEIIDGVPQNLTNLIANNTYYLIYHDNNKFRKYDFYLAMNYMEEIPFDYLYVYDGQGTKLIRLKNDIKKIDNEWVIKFHIESPFQLSPGLMYSYEKYRLFVYQSSYIFF